jgi:hypothetical protein
MTGKYCFWIIILICVNENLSSSSTIISLFAMCIPHDIIAIGTMDCGNARKGASGTSPHAYADC